MNKLSHKNHKKGQVEIIILVALALFILIPALFGDKTEMDTKTATSTVSGTGTTNSGFGGFFNIFTPVTPTPEEQAANKTYDQTPTEPENPAPQKTKPVEISKTIIDMNASPYKDKIDISNVLGTGLYAKDESITLSNISAEENINITGFKIETSDHQSFIIPKGYNLPGYSPFTEGDIILKPNDTILINVGTQDRNINFRENLCTGYFDQTSDFGWILSHNCPRPDTSKMFQLTDQCLNTIDTISSCTIPSFGPEINNDCNNFVQEHYSYVGCVKDFKSRADFYSNKWLMWMQKSGEFFRNVRELVTLKDANGKNVDEYNY